MKALYDSKTKSIEDRGIRYLLSDDYKYRVWLEVEIALAQAQGELGIIPEAVAKNLEKDCKIEKIDFRYVEELKERIGHGFMPFLKAMIKTVDEETGKYIHYGVTTQNIQQSSQLLIAKRVTDKMMFLLREIIENLSFLALKYKGTILPGRTHGKHALPITYGYKVSVWLYELLEAENRINRSTDRIYTVMMGGAVGAYNSMGDKGPLLQERVANLLGLAPMGIPSRNIGVFKSELVSNFALLATTFHKIAEEVYLTSSEEFDEVSEYIRKEEVGSSTMPQKSNPKLSKGIIANSQKLYSLVPLMLNSSTRPFEADSSAYFLQENCIQEALELMLEIMLRAEELTKGVIINEVKMEENLALTKGLINSEYLMMKLAETLGKDESHKTVHEIIKNTLEKKIEFLEALCNNEIIKNRFSRDEIEKIIDPKNYLGLSEKIAQTWSDKAFRKND